MRSFAGWKKVLLFGLVGAAGCLIAAIFGELPLALMVPASASSPRQVDVMFVLDVTGSMAGEIAGVQRGIQDFATALTVKNLPVRVGLIAFRDRLLGEEPQILSFNGQPFTESAESFSRQVGRLQARGGGDERESSLDAVVLAARQPFRRQATKVMVLITDAPPHAPDRETRSLSEAARAIRERGINQVHLVIRKWHLPLFQQLQESAPGEVFLLTEMVFGRHDFHRVLPQIGEEIAQRTLKGLQTQTSFTWHSFWQLLAVIGVWTGMLAIGVTLALIAGQNYYLQRWPLTAREGVKGTGGGLAAGLLAGAAGQLLFAAAPNVSGLDAVARVVSWTVLGGLLGKGIASFVPNLPPRRALIGGTIGGAVGAIGFLWAAATVGDVAGRLLGATVLGFCIGLMIALIEAALREAWLEVRYGSGEARTVSLGREPVSLGSASTCTVYAPTTLPVAARYTLEAGQIRYEDVAAARTLQVPIGDQRQIGPLIVTVRGATPTAAPVAATDGHGPGLTLRLSSGRTIPLRVGARLSAHDLPGLQALGEDGIGAEVVRHPQDPTVLGLKNLSRRPWLVTAGQGERRTVEPQRSIRLAAGTRIDFGEVEGEVW